MIAPGSVMLIGGLDSIVFIGFDPFTPPCQPCSLITPLAFQCIITSRELLDC